jgi:hypothetical protein
MIENLTAAMAAVLTAYLDRIHGEVAAFAGRLADLSTYPFVEVAFVTVLIGSFFGFAEVFVGEVLDANRVQKFKPGCSSWARRPAPGP